MRFIFIFPCSSVFTVKALLFGIIGPANLKYCVLYVSTKFKSVTIPLFVSFSFILTLTLYVILSPTLYSFLGFTTSFFTSNSWFFSGFSNFWVYTSDSFPAPSIAFICIYLSGEYGILPMFILSISSFVSNSYQFTGLVFPSVIPYCISLLLLLLLHSLYHF